VSGDHDTLAGVPHEMADDTTDGPAGVAIPSDQLPPETLRRLVEEFVTRDGTDYGAVEASTEDKIAHVMRELESGEAQVVFDPESETTNIVPTRELAGD